MKKYLDFSQEFGKVDEELIAEAGKPWTIKRGDIFQRFVCLYRSDKSGTDKEWDIINNQRSNFG